MGGEYDIEGGTKINATVQLIGEDKQLDPLGQQYIDVSIRTVADDKIIDPLTGMPMTMYVTDPTSPYYGQKLSLTYSEYTGRGYANYGNNLLFGDLTNMTLYTDWAEVVPDIVPGVHGIVPGKARTETEFLQHATHEFGHTLGIEDGYAEGSKPRVPYYLAPTWDIMAENYGRGVGPTSFHMTMILNASRYFEWQVYASYDKGGKYAELDDYGNYSYPIITPKH